MGSSGGDSGTPDVVQQIKASGAKSLRATFIGGEVQSIAVPDVRRKWARLRALLESLPEQWVRIEGFDAKGALLCCVDNPDAPNELEDLEHFPPGTEAGRVDPLLQLMLRAQDVALSRQERMMRPLLDSHAKLLELVSKRLLASERALVEQFERNKEYAEMVQQLILRAGGDDDDGTLKLLAEILPRMLAGKTTPPNGAPE